MSRFSGIINAIKLFEAKQVGAIWDFEHENGLLHKNSQSLIGIRFNPFNVFQGKTLKNQSIKTAFTSFTDT